MTLTGSSSGIWNSQLGGFWALTASPAFSSCTAWPPWPAIVHLECLVEGGSRRDAGGSAVLASAPQHLPNGIAGVEESNARSQIYGN